MINQRRAVGAVLLTATLLLQSFFLHAEQSVTKVAKHCLWRVKGATNSVYLLGSVHLLKENFYPLPEPIETAYSNCATVVFEIDQDRPAEIQQKFAAVRRLPDNKTLEDVLSKETYALLESYLQTNKIPMQAFERLQPWMVALFLAAREWEKLGYDPDAGVEHYFFDKAKADHKRMDALETIDFQLGLFTSLTPEENDSLVKGTLLEVKESRKMIGALVAAWKAGDVNKLDKLVSVGMKEFPRLHKKLVIDRNHQWIGQIEQMIKSGQNIFVVVGAGHLGGKQGVLELLKAKGYKLEQL